MYVYEIKIFYDQIYDIKSEIKDLNITIDKAIVIHVLNSLNLSFT